MHVDRPSRNRLADAIRRYLADDITAFEFDELLFDKSTPTTDKTVDFVTFAIWYHYDDCKDHKVVLSKMQWDYFHRLLLILESDAHVQVESRRQWIPPQAIALTSLAIFLFLAFQTGFGIHLMAFSIPFGVLSMLLAFWRKSYEPQPSQGELLLHPFSSFMELRQTRKSVDCFSKQRYPNELKDRQIRSASKNKILCLPWYVYWLIFSPIALLFQTLPLRQTTTFVFGSCDSIRPQA